MKREDRPKYQQPYNIRFYDCEEPPLRERLVLSEHGRQKYDAKYLKSKQSKRKPE